MGKGHGPGDIFPPSKGNGGLDKSMQTPHTPGKYKAPVDSNMGNSATTTHTINEHFAELTKPFPSNPGRKDPTIR